MSASVCPSSLKCSATEDSSVLLLYMTIVTHRINFTKYYFFAKNKIFAHNRYLVTLSPPSIAGLVHVYAPGPNVLLVLYLLF